MSKPVLSVRGLRTVIQTSSGAAEVVADASFDVHRNETLALVGESGCGKSTTALSIMGLTADGQVTVTGGEVLLDGVDLLKLSEQERRSVRGSGMAMVYQDPMTSLNPLMRIGDQVAEVLLTHGVAARAAHERAREVLTEVGMPDADRAARAYPHEFSGGMRQRAVIAMALAMRPKLLIADEPTTALDATIQQQVIMLIRQIQADTGMAVVWITHDLGVVARVADRVCVMYAGRIVEDGPSRRVFRRPEHPYTDALIGSIPRLTGLDRPPLRLIPGAPPDPTDPVSGCPFHPRCPQAGEICRAEMPEMTERGGSLARCWVSPERWTRTLPGTTSEVVAQ